MPESSQVLLIRTLFLLSRSGCTVDLSLSWTPILHGTRRKRASGEPQILRVFSSLRSIVDQNLWCISLNVIPSITL